MKWLILILILSVVGLASDFEHVIARPDMYILNFAVIVIIAGAIGILKRRSPKNVTKIVNEVRQHNKN